MTREEAIAYGEDYLKDLITACCHIEEKHKEFVRMAIAALKAEFCEDAVSREAVIAVLDWHEHEKSEIESYIREIAEDIKALPPAIPKPTECEDAVSREFMYKLGAKCIAVRTENGELVAIAPIESLPSVTPKQKWIPEGATNGDVIKTMFPNAKITEYGDCLVDFTYQTESQFFTLDWWNAPYNEGDSK